MGLNAVAFLWGLAEATLFFIVPDVWLSAVAVWRGRRAALLSTAWVIGGAVLGGLLMYAWGAWDLERARAALDHLPAISPTMMDGVRDSLERRGAVAMVVGSLTGVPYKIYAAMAEDAGLPMPLFLLVSVPARALRLVLVVVVADWLNTRLPHRLTVHQRAAVFGTAWLVFYGFYFAAMPI